MALSTWSRRRRGGLRAAIAASLLVGLVGLGRGGEAIATPMPQQAAMEAAKRLETARRFLQEAMFRRDDLYAVLGVPGADGRPALDAALMEAVVEAVYPIYIREVGEAAQEAIDRLYTIGPADEVTLPRLDGGEFVAIARRVSERFRAAADAAAAEAARSGANLDRTAEAIVADLFRRFAARQLQVEMAGYHDPDSSGYDTLKGFATARSECPDIAAAAARADRDEHARAALDGAIAAYRAEGLAIGTALVERSGASAVVTRVFWGGPDQQPAEIARIIESRRPLGRRWLDANERLGIAIERYLALGVGPEGEDRFAAARWRLRHLAATASQSIPTRSAAELIADAAVALGVCSDEAGSISAIMDASLVELAARRAATLLAHTAWLAELERRGVRAQGALPNDALIGAYRRQRATEESLRSRVLAAIRSEMVASALRAVPDPFGDGAGPRWLEALREQSREQREVEPQEVGEGTP